jgi:hypothetical protein
MQFQKGFYIDIEFFVLEINDEPVKRIFGEQLGVM